MIPFFKTYKKEHYKPPQPEQRMIKLIALGVWVIIAYLLWSLEKIYT